MGFKETQMSLEFSKMIYISTIKSNGEYMNNKKGERLACFTAEQLEHYTHLIIKHAVEETVKLEGKDLHSD